jgi:enoyl-CoA hydratase
VDYEKITFREGVVCRLTLNDPERRNALSKQLMAEVWDALGKAERSEECRVVILDAVGPVFSAGHDISEEIPVGSPPTTQESWREFLEFLRRDWYQRWWDYNKPVICKIDGTAIAGGIELSCFADAAFCSEESVFTYWPISTVSVAFSPSLILPWIIGIRKAKELMITKGFNGREAEDCGLVNKCLPRDKLEGHVMETAEIISRILPETVRLGKFCFRFIYDRLGVRDAIVLGSEMDILAHCHQADREFQNIMRQEGVKGIVDLARERMEGT